MKLGLSCLSWRPVTGVAICMLVVGGFAATMTYTVKNVADTTPGQDLWQYSYSVSGFAFGTAQGFSVFFDRNLYKLIQSPPPPVNAGWDAISVQPDLALNADGFYDAQALVAGPSLADPFTVNFVWLGTGTPGSQSFTIYDSNFATLQQGQTIPEPGTFALLLLAGIGMTALRRSRRHAR